MHTYQLDFTCNGCGSRLKHFVTSSEPLTKHDLDHVSFNVKCDVCGLNRMRIGFNAKSARAAFNPASLRADG
jgi:hypothetical protein